MQKLVNQTFFYLFLLAYLGGMVAYDIIGIGFVDEIYVALLVSFYGYCTFVLSDWRVNKVFLAVLAIFAFYFVYSLQIGSNTPQAIVSDLLIQLKPYLAFFCAYQLKPAINSKQKKLLNQLSLVCWFLLIPIGLAGFVAERNFKMLIGHPTSFAAAVTASSMVYLFTSEGLKKNRLIFVAMLSLGILSARSKFYGFFVLAAFAALYFNDIKRLQLNFKSGITLFGLLAAILFVAKDKIQFYFLQGITGDVETDYLARMALYATSLSIFVDYFPFGSGLASFATHYSGVYYSDIYVEYGINHIWGLNKSYTSFVADTYYPSLAQFGIVGALLYVMFWIYVLRRAATFNLTRRTMHFFALSVCIIGFIAIENVADASFTGNKGAFMMLFLGYLFANLQSEKHPQPVAA